MYRRVKRRLGQTKRALFGLLSHEARTPDPWGNPPSIILALALATCLFCDTACSTLEAVTERLIAPFESYPGRRRRASAACPCGLIRSLRQWLCSPSHNEKNCRLSRFIQISHNPPPLSPSFPARCI